MRQPALIRLLILPVLLLACSSCVRQVEGTGRTQFALYSDSEMNQLGLQAYQDVLTKEKRCADPVANAMLIRVGSRLAEAAPNHGFKYEFTLLESDTVNAFCLPGGKVAVYTGILGLCRNEAGLAAVLGHEIAHAIANHGNERMTQGVLVQGTQQALGSYLESTGVSPTTLNLGMAAFGAGAKLGVLLPFSRKHELEADYLGLTYMAAAGYDPKEAVAFWERFATLGGANTPTWMNTHPASADRAKALQAKQAEAQALYETSADQRGAGATVPAKYLPPK